LKIINERYADLWDVAVAREGKNILFCADDIWLAVGYSSLAGLKHHIVGFRDVPGDNRNWLSLKQINKIAINATRTPRMKKFAAWAKEVQNKLLALEQAAAHIAKQKKPEASPWPTPKPLFDMTLKQAAEQVGMKHSEFITWMTTQGYLLTYQSNGHLKLSAWFKANGFGCNPLADSGRVSNTVRITPKGLEFVKNRINSERESGVLAFAASAHNERVKLEAEIDALIKKTFKPFSSSKYTKLMNAPEVYEIWEDDLLKKVREVIAQVKLKGKE